MTDPLSDSVRIRDNAVRATLVGLRAAWCVPSIIAHDLRTLLVSSATLPRRSPADAAAIISVRVAHRMLALLARVRPSRWRATCLHRSVAECLALRAFGWPARVVIGVGDGAAPAETVAHAWVECEGVRCRSTRGAADLETLAATRA